LQKNGKRRIQKNGESSVIIRNDWAQTQDIPLEYTYSQNEFFTILYILLNYKLVYTHTSSFFALQIYTAESKIIFPRISANILHIKNISTMHQIKFI
jgi:hypothetical protein